MTTRVLVFGAGGHGAVVADALTEAGHEVLGFVDDGGAEGVLGDRAWLMAQGGAAAPTVVAIGDNASRAEVQAALRGAGVAIATCVHPRATVARSADVAEGAHVLAGVVINPRAVIGEGAIVNTGAVVEHDCVVEPFAHVSPNATLGGGVFVGRAAHVGIGATVLPGRRVGAGAVVGGGAVVTRDVAPGVTVVGVPARVRS